MEYKLLATKASIITVTRPNLVELQKAMRRILGKMENFIIADVEYTMDGAGNNKSYSAIIMGALPEGYVDINDEGGEGEEPIINPTPDNPDNPEPTEPTNPPSEPEDEETKEKIRNLEEQQQETVESINEMKDSIAEILAYIETLKAKEDSNG